MKNFALRGQTAHAMIIIRRSGGEYKKILEAAGNFLICPGRAEEKLRFREKLLFGFFLKFELSGYF